MIEDLAGWPGMAPVLGGYVAFLAGVALYDARTRRVPNVAVYPALAISLGLAFVRPDGAWWSFVLAGFGALALFMVLGIVSGGGMGMGDAKLAAVVGLVAGWPGVLVALFAAFATGGIVAGLLMAAGRIGRRDPIPFAPALAVGALVAAVAGRPLWGLVWQGIG